VFVFKAISSADISLPNTSCKSCSNIFWKIHFRGRGLRAWSDSRKWFN